MGITGLLNEPQRENNSNFIVAGMEWPLEDELSIFFCVRLQGA